MPASGPETVVPPAPAPQGIHRRFSVQRGVPWCTWKPGTPDLWYSQRGEGFRSPFPARPDHLCPHDPVPVGEIPLFPTPGIMNWSG